MNIPRSLIYAPLAALLVGITGVVIGYRISADSRAAQRDAAVVALLERVHNYRQVEQVGTVSTPVDVPGAEGVVRITGDTGGWVESEQVETQITEDVPPSASPPTATASSPVVTPRAEGGTPLLRGGCDTSLVRVGDTVLARQDWWAETLVAGNTYRARRTLEPHTLEIASEAVRRARFRVDLGYGWTPNTRLWAVGVHRRVSWRRDWVRMVMPDSVGVQFVHAQVRRFGVGSESGVAVVAGWEF